MLLANIVLELRDLIVSFVQARVIGTNIRLELRGSVVQSLPGRVILIVPLDLRFT